MNIENTPIHIFFFKKYILAMPHSMWILVSQPEMNLSPLQWKHGVLTTGPPEKSQIIFSLQFFMLV